MARPIVLVATTDPVMAYALQERLKDNCKTLGLKLEVCPDGNESDIADAKVRAYDSAEALFDALEKRDPVELADTLVVLDVGTDLDNAFRPAASQDNWHVTSNRAGVAVELLLRFPQVFPVFLSPSVPVSTDEAKSEGNDKVKVVESKWRDAKENEWAGFYRLREEICTKHKPGEPNWEACKSLHAFQVPLHFVSPLYGDGLVSTLARFARGMRCWFDPTGLRTLVKNRFLGTVFGNDQTWKADTQRKVLLDRLNNVCVAIDEEREFALLNAYTAWKFGRRAWVVTSFGEFDDSPLWVYNEGDFSNVVVLRDIDVRFPDILDASKLGLWGISPRELMKDNYSCLWSKKETRVCATSIDAPGNKIGKDWRVRAVSSENGIISDPKVWENDKFGQRRKGSKIEYFGLNKPIGTIYDLKPCLFEKQGDKESIAARIEVVGSEGNEGGHGAPYTNLAMAEALLISSGRCKDHSSSHLIGALLAMEAYELLLGMSKTTALEALLSLHRHEAAAEVNFPGVSHSLEIKDRIEDVEQTLKKLYEDNKTNARDKEPVKRMFLSQFWAELRIQYKDGEQFDAAEEANVQSLMNMRWKPKWLQFQKSERRTSLRWSRWRQLLAKTSRAFKLVVLRTATSVTGWLLTTTVISFILAILYGAISPQVHWQPDTEGVSNFFEIWWQVIMSMLQMQFNDPKNVPAVIYPESLRNASSPVVSYPVIVDFFTHTLAIAHLGISYVLFGLLIAMIYRKITRA